jgi:hypothetical protein
MQHQYYRPYKQFKDSKPMEEAESRYLTIWAW